MDKREVIPHEHSRISRFFLARPIKPIPEQRSKSLIELRPWTRILWTYIDHMVRLGYDRVILSYDIPLVDPRESMKVRFTSYKKYLKKHIPTPITQFTECWAILYAIKSKLLLSFSAEIVTIGCQIGTSLLSRYLILQAEKLAVPEHRGDSHNRAVGLLIGFCIVDAMQTIFQLTSWYMGEILANNTKIIAMSAIHDKMLRLGPQQRHDYSAAKIVTISGTDCIRGSNGFRHLCDLVTFPINMGASLGVLIYMIGVSAVPGMGLILAGLIVSALAAFYVSKLRMISMPYMDKRVSLTRETLKNISIVKYYGWEEPFVKVVSAMRKLETKYIRFIEAVDAFNVSFVIAIPSWAGALSFGVKIAISASLNPSGAFPALTLFQTFIQTMAEVSLSLTEVADSWVSIKRLNSFFRLPEVPSYIEALPNTPENRNVVFRVKDADFAWLLQHESSEDAVNNELEEILANESDKGNNEKNQLSTSATNNSHLDAEEESQSETKVVLKNTNLTIARGTMNLVIGRVGSGKSSLLSIFLNAIPKSSGSACIASGVNVTGVLSQWSSSASVRENILFGLPFDAKRYAETIRICDLQSDIDILAHGESTEVGENGVTLSGGQRARLALARCIYSYAELIVLDDVLSAMDSKVGSYVFQELLKLTRSGKRTIVFSTNNLRWSSQADTVISLDGEGNVHQSFQKAEIKQSVHEVIVDEKAHSNEPEPSHEAIEAQNEEEFAKAKALAMTYTTDGTYSENQLFGAGFGEANAAAMKSNADFVNQAHELLNEQHEERQEVGHDEKHHDHSYSKFEEKFSIKSSIDSSVADTDDFKGTVANPKSDNEKAGGASESTEGNTGLMNEEDRSIGTVKNEVMIRYFGLNRFYGLSLGCLMIFALMLYSTSESMADVVLNWWTGNSFHRSQNFWIGIYFMDVTLVAAFYSLFAITFSWLGTASSTMVHNGALKGLYGTTMTYFHQNPLGRIMTRFTQDMVNLDTLLLAFGRMVFMSFFPMVASFIVIFVYVPWTILCLIPLFFITLIIFAFYLPASREINRCNQLYQSRAMQILSEHIEGQEVIVAYDQSEASQKKLNTVLDDSISANMYNSGIHFWAAARCGLLCEIVTLLTLFLAVYNVFDLNPAEVGLMITTLPTVRANLTGLLPMYSLFYNQLNSVERLDQYCTRLPVEGESMAARMNPNLRSWKPTRCDIDFKNACLRYRDGLPLALNNLTCRIEGGKKVGICGRTGAGKSTIISALFRFTEICGGDITIDGQNIAELPLDTLRNTFAIIPQSPVLFQGTIKSNLDPFEQFSDDVLISALEESGLPARSSNSKFRLQARVEEEGTNLSLGERQMLALARVIVRNSQILILDEATAAVDHETDEHIQRAIKAKFNGRTILCIAHRLETIIDYDEIMVMGRGGVLLEFGPPAKLYQRNGVFTDMCKEGGVVPK